MHTGGTDLFGTPNESKKPKEDMQIIEIGHSYQMTGKIEVEVPASITKKEDIIDYIKAHADDYKIHPRDDDYIDGSYRIDLIYWPDGSDVDILD